MPGVGKPTDAQARLVDKLTASAAANASLGDVKHIVILMQENRSFDHCFGTLSGTRGFSDPNVAVRQPAVADRPAAHLQGADPQLPTPRRCGSPSPASASRCRT